MHKNDDNDEKKKTWIFDKKNGKFAFIFGEQKKRPTKVK